MLPINEVKEEARFTFYSYKGLTPTEVVSKIGMVKAYIYFKKTPIYSSNKDELKRDIAVHVEKHKKILREKLSKADSVSFDERMVFFNMITATIRIIRTVSLIQC